MIYSEAEIKKLLRDVSRGKISNQKAFQKLKDLPYQDIGFARVDHHRQLRKGFPEVLYCPGKTLGQIIAIAGIIISAGSTLLATRATQEIYVALKKIYPHLRFDKIARVIFTQRKKITVGKGLILIITAGTSDIPVAQEAAVTARIMGNRVGMLSDVGISGIHRLLSERKLLRRAKIIIVVAGMEGALASVVAGLVKCPIIAVPTSIGYGANFKGMAALLTMLNTCSPGLVVVNIDNGFGAGYFASLINK